METTATKHVRRIEAAFDRPPSEMGEDAITRSWKRSTASFHIDPVSKQELQVLTLPELSSRQEQAGMMVRAAQPELDRLYQIVRPARYVVLLTDKDGVVVDHRDAEEDAEEFKRWGLWLGRVWSESVEGTNGIGTALVDGRPTTVHRDQHFRVRHTELSCSGAPIFDPVGKLIGVIDVSCFDPRVSDHAHAMTGALTGAVARGIEERLFRAQYQDDWVIAAVRPDKPAMAMLLAVNEERRIVGANREARRAFEKKGHVEADGILLWDVYERNDPLFRRRNSGDSSGTLICRTNGASLAAIVTPPMPAHMGKFRLGPGSLLWRPRTDELLAGNRPAPADRPLGLTLATARRVRDYVDGHLDEELPLSALAGIAGLSVSHFTRAFKKTEGVTPHAFVLERRLAKARRLLIETPMSLAEIAFAVGFADQSHFARYFRRDTGVSPSEFRKSQTP